MREIVEILVLEDLLLLFHFFVVFVKIAVVLRFPFLLLLIQHTWGVLHILDIRPLSEIVLILHNPICFRLFLHEFWSIFVAFLIQIQLEVLDTDLFIRFIWTLFVRFYAILFLRWLIILFLLHLRFFLYRKPLITNGFEKIEIYIEFFLKFLQLFLCVPVVLVAIVCSNGLFRGEIYRDVDWDRIFKLFGHFVIELFKFLEFGRRL